MKITKSTIQTNTSNVMGLVKVSDYLDLEKIFMELDSTSYEPEQYSGLVYRSTDPVGTVTLFKSGKAICTGVNDPKSVKKIIASLIEKLRFLDIPVYNSYQIQIRNVVITKTLNQPINLAKLALSFGLENVDYEPDDFPGLIYKMKEPHITFIIFDSGKIICTGAKSDSEAERAFEQLVTKLKHYKIIK